MNHILLSIWSVLHAKAERGWIHSIWPASENNKNSQPQKKIPFIANQRIPVSNCAAQDYPPKYSSQIARMTSCYPSILSLVPVNHRAWGSGSCLDQHPVARRIQYPNLRVCSTARPLGFLADPFYSVGSIQFQGQRRRRGKSWKYLVWMWCWCWCHLHAAYRSGYTDGDGITGGLFALTFRKHRLGPDKILWGNELSIFPQVAVFVA